MLDVTFYGSQIPEIYYVEADESEEKAAAEETTLGPPVFKIEKKLIKVLMKARLDAAPLAEMAAKEENGDTVVVRAATWMRQASVFAERNLKCALSRPLDGKKQKCLDCLERSYTIYERNCFATPGSSSKTLWKQQQICVHF